VRPAVGTAALGIALAFAGAAFASPSLMIPGFALLGLALVSVVWTEMAARDAAVERAPGPARIVEGDAYPLALTLRRGLVPPPGGELVDPLLDRPVSVGPFRPRRLELEVRMPRRGRHVLAGTAWIIRDPLGLRTRAVRAAPAGELLVLPRIEPVSARAMGVAGGLGAGTASAGEEGASSVREARAVEFEVDGLRPYRHGSPASRIHWPALARTGEMHERRIVAGAEAVPLVALDAEDPASEAALDRAVRAAASLCVHLAPASGCSLLLPGHRVPSALDSRLRAWPQLHARLAVVGAGASTRMPGAARARGSIFWVTAGSPGVEPRRMRALGPGPHYVVSAVRPLDGRVAFEVAGCFGVAVGSRGRRAVAA